MKIFFYVCFGLLLLVITNATYIIEPEITTELARKQFVDPSIQTDTIMRSLDLSRFIWILWALFIALGLTMFNVYEKTINFFKGESK